MAEDELAAKVEAFTSNEDYNAAKELLDAEYSKFDYFGPGIDWIERFGTIYLRILRIHNDYQAAFEVGEAFVSIYDCEKVKFDKPDLLKEIVNSFINYSELHDYGGKGKKASEEAQRLCEDYENGLDLQWQGFAKTTLHTLQQVAADRSNALMGEEEQQPQQQQQQQPKPKAKKKKKQKAGRGKGKIVNEQVAGGETIDENVESGNQVAGGETIDENVESGNQVAGGETIDDNVDSGNQAAGLIWHMQKGDRIYEVDCGIKYTFRKYLHHDLYHGDGKYPYSNPTTEHSFVPATTPRLKEFNALKPLSSSHESILTIYGHIPIETDTGTETLLVTDPIFTLQQYFSQFLSSEQLSKTDWWKIVGSKVETIVLDVVEAILFMEKKNNPCAKFCGDLFKNLYVTEKGRGRILPSCDQSFKMNDDVDGLVDFIMSAMMLPFPEERFKVEDFQLSAHLTHFLTYQRGEVKKYMPLWFILEHPFLWTNQDCVNFTYKLRTLRTEYAQFEKAFRKVFKKNKSIFENWQQRIAQDDVPDLYKTILAKPVEANANANEANDSDTMDQTSSDLPTNAVKLKDYGSRIDLIRFVSNVLAHANESEYLNGRKEGVIRKVRIIQEVLQFFPDFFTTIKECIFRSVVVGNKQQKPLDLEEFKILSSRYD